jgi:hypothetical protein
MSFIFSTPIATADVPVPTSGRLAIFIEQTTNTWYKKNSSNISTPLSESDLNDKVKISLTDTNEEYLFTKIIGTTNKIVLTKVNPGANEQLVISLGTDVFDKSADDLDDISEGTANKHFTSTEKTKLSGIETGATADQTAAEIETAYNSQVAVVSQLDAEAGTSTSVWRWTVERVRQAIAAFAVQKNASITGATKTKVTYDAKGLVTSGADATTADIADSTNKRYVTDAQLTVIGNTSGTNTGDETLARIGAINASATTKTTPVDADSAVIVDSENSNVMKRVTFTNLKAFFKTYFDSLYNLYVHPNHSGEVTSTGDGTTTITNNIVTNAKLATVATATFKGRTTAGTGNVEDLTIAQSKALLNLAGTNSGDETVTTIGALINGATSKTTPVDADQIGLMDSAASNVLKKVSWLNIKATLKTYFDTLYNAIQTQAHAEIYFATINAVVTPIAAANTPVKILGTTTLGFSSGNFGTGGLSNRLVWNGVGTIRIMVSVSGSVIKNGAGVDTARIYIAQNGVVLARTKNGTRVENTDDASFATNAIIDIAPGQFIEAFIENRDSGNDFTVRDLTLIITQILN